MESIYDRVQFYRFGKEEKRQIVHKVRKLLAGEKRILLAVIFGSFTRRDSVRDIDVCVYSVPTLNLSDLLSLNAKIELYLGLATDLVELVHLSAPLRFNVLRNGILVKGERTLLHQLVDQAYSEREALEYYLKNRDLTVLDGRESWFEMGGE